MSLSAMHQVTAKRISKKSEIWTIGGSEYILCRTYEDYLNSLGFYMLFDGSFFIIYDPETGFWYNTSFSRPETTLETFKAIRKHNGLSY